MFSNANLQTTMCECKIKKFNVNQQAMALGLILEINGYKYKLLKYNRRFNQKRHCIVLPFLSDMKEISESMFH